MTKSDVIEYYGTARELVRVLSETPWPLTEQAVSGWDEVIPWGRAYQIESVTHGELRAD